MTKGEKEIADLVGKYLDKVSKLANNYEKAIGNLEKIREDYRSSWWQVLLKFLPYITPFLFLLILFLAIRFLDCNTHISYAGVEVSRSCK